MPYNFLTVNARFVQRAPFPFSLPPPSRLPLKAVLPSCRRSLFVMPKQPFYHAKAVLPSCKSSLFNHSEAVPPTIQKHPPHSKSFIGQWSWCIAPATACTVHTTVVYSACNRLGGWSFYMAAFMSLDAQCKMVVKQNTNYRPGGWSF